MTGRSGTAPPDSIAWLLGGDASVRYHTLTRLLGTAPDDPEVEAARRAIMTEGPVPRILAEQQADGHWEGPDRFYRAKYRGTVWTLIILAELGADGADARVRAACEAVLRDSQDPGSGGFSYDRGKKAGGGLPSGVIPCLTGNVVFSLVRLGMLDDPRVQRALDWITTYQRFDDGDGEAPTGWPYDRLEMCWGRHTCHMGAVKALKALAEVPPERRTPAAHATISAGAEFMLRHHVHRRSHDLSPRLQARLAPLRLPAHVPDGRARDPARAHAPRARGRGGAGRGRARRGRRSRRLGRGPDGAGGTPILGDERLREALDLVASRADAQGRWKLQQTFNDRFVVPIEAKGEPSRWVTLRALEVLKNASSTPESPSR